VLLQHRLGFRFRIAEILTAAIPRLDLTEALGVKERHILDQVLALLRCHNDNAARLALGGRLGR